MKRQGLFLVHILPVLLLSLVGCRNDDQPTATATITAVVEATATPSAASTAENEIVIGAILFQNDNFYATVALGMEHAAAAAGAAIRFRVHEQDGTLEKQWIEQFTADGVDAIIISPRVPDGSIAAIAAAHAAGIKIICFNGCFTDSATEAYVSGVIETDQYGLGYTIGAYMADWVEVNGISEPHVGILSCCPQRNEGMRQALNVFDVNWIEVISLEGYLADEAAVIGESMLQENPQINIIWAENEGGTVGAVAAVRGLDLAGQVYVFGVDISPQIAEMLLADDNILQAVSAQSPYQIGQLSVTAALDAVQGKGNAGYNNVSSTFYSRDDLAAVELFLANQ